MQKKRKRERVCVSVGSNPIRGFGVRMFDGFEWVRNRNFCFLPLLSIFWPKNCPKAPKNRKLWQISQKSPKLHYLTVIFGVSAKPHLVARKNRTIWTFGKNMSALTSVLQTYLRRRTTRLIFELEFFKVWIKALLSISRQSILLTRKMQSLTL